MNVWYSGTHEQLHSQDHGYVPAPDFLKLVVALGLRDLTAIDEFSYSESQSLASFQSPFTEEEWLETFAREVDADGEA